MNYIGKKWFFFKIETVVECQDSLDGLYLSFLQIAIKSCGRVIGQTKCVRRIVINITRAVLPIV